MAGEDSMLQMDLGSGNEPEEEITVQVGAEPGEGQVVKTPAAPAGGTGGDVDPVADLKSQFATMTQRVTAVESDNERIARERDEALRRAQTAETQVVSSQLDTVLSGLAAAQAEADAAEQEYVRASEAGDFSAQARAQRKMAAAESRITRLSEAKDDLEEATKRRPAQETRHREPSQRPPADPVEAFIAGGKLTPKSAAWVRAHPECATDTVANARMLAAHNLAVADGIAIESEEYFRRIEEGIKPAAPGKDGRRPSSAAAPGGGPSGALNGGGTEVRLTKREAESATDGTLVWNYPDPTGKGRWKVGDPIGLVEMARRKAAGKAAGLYDRNNIEA